MKSFRIESKNPLDAEKLISKIFDTSYMNNSKWNKLIVHLTEVFEQIQINYKLIYSEEIKGYLFDTADNEPFFIEPILYKEIEWIEIPHKYENWINTNNRKAGRKIYNQNLTKVKTEIDSIGKFQLDVSEHKIKLYAYM